MTKMATPIAFVMTVTAMILNGNRNGVGTCVGPSRNPLASRCFCGRPYLDGLKPSRLPRPSSDDEDGDADRVRDDCHGDDFEREQERGGDVRWPEPESVSVALFLWSALS